MQVQANATGRMIRTATPGIYKKGNRYVVVFREPTGRQRKRSARTLAEARGSIRASVTADKARGEFFQTSRVTVADHFDAWLPAYTGRTSHGIREQTKRGYADRMRLHVLPHTRPS